MKKFSKLLKSNRIFLFLSIMLLLFFFKYPLMKRNYPFLNNDYSQIYGNDNLNNHSVTDTNSGSDLGSKYLIIKPYCSCRADLLVIKHNSSIYEYNKHFIYFNASHHDNNINLSNDSQTISVHSNPRFTCNLHSALRLGPKQKVISYSLYGDRFSNYNESLHAIVNAAGVLFPEWTIRVYYDRPVNQSFICDFECKYEKIDFCNIAEIPFTHKVYDYFSGGITQHDTNIMRINLSAVHAMMWRWLPITDDFVDYFSSRDADSSLIQREKDSVDVWLKRNSLFHIMRDHPYHNTEILGGMWGHANVFKRQSGYDILDLMIKHMKYFNRNGQSPKSFDQLFLALKVWPLARHNATIHDSYNCLRLGGEPFPTQREPNLFCFVVCFYPCCNQTPNKTDRMSICPNSCRPLTNKDWEFC